MAPPDSVEEAIRDIKQVYQVQDKRVKELVFAFLLLQVLVVIDILLSTTVGCCRTNNVLFYT
jgi:hypothetical protein